MWCSTETHTRVYREEHTQHSKQPWDQIQDTLASLFYIVFAILHFLHILMIISNSNLLYDFENHALVRPVCIKYIKCLYIIRKLCPEITNQSLQNNKKAACSITLLSRFATWTASIEFTKPKKKALVFLYRSSMIKIIVNMIHTASYYLYGVGTRNPNVTLLLTKWKPKV